MVMVRFRVVSTRNEDGRDDRGLGLKIRCATKMLVRVPSTSTSEELKLLLTRNWCSNTVEYYSPHTTASSASLNIAMRLNGSRCLIVGDGVGVATCFLDPGAFRVSVAARAIVYRPESDRATIASLGESRKKPVSPYRACQ